MGDNVHIVAHEAVVIGDNCLIASKVFISDTSHGGYSGVTGHTSPTVPPALRPMYTRAVTIGNNVWIGENVSILLGVTIADGCIIGANAVVTNDVPRDCIALGVPARTVKRFNSDSQEWEAV
jgi:acetyltransferase-like isoleucine patch superfamily enzyme